MRRSKQHQRMSSCPWAAVTACPPVCAVTLSALITCSATRPALTDWVTNCLMAPATYSCIYDSWGLRSPWQCRVCTIPDLAHVGWLAFINIGNWLFIDNTWVSYLSLVLIIHNKGMQFELPPNIKLSITSITKVSSLHAHCLCSDPFLLQCHHKGAVGVFTNSHKLFG